MTDHTHSDYADGFDAGVDAGARQFRDFLAKHAPVYVKDIQQWHRDFLAARNAGVKEGYPCKAHHLIACTQCAAGVKEGYPCKAHHLIACTQCAAGVAIPLEGRDG